MAKNKPKINNTVAAPKYRVYHDQNSITLYLDDSKMGNEFKFGVNPYVNELFVYSEYKDNRLHRIYTVPDYTRISTAEEMFQNSLICDIPMDFSTIVQLQKALKHHFYQYLYPSKRELCNLKMNYIIDTTS